MERKKIAIFSWESLFIDRRVGLANVTTDLAQNLDKKHEVHFFTRGNHDFTFFGVHHD